eukprot:TRINITY_DN1012_c0_g1_i2.p3 TRINITY_DN1012_c0_g1~~TRINITY_DN1012_c0_g1_i2.p3  ORF type:complete len:118 (-),score=45.18 TRINITY_DN1012_c0_g1_i2:219-572(-)
MDGSCSSIAYGFRNGSAMGAETDGVGLNSAASADIGLNILALGFILGLSSSSFFGVSVFASWEAWEEAWEVWEEAWEAWEVDTGGWETWEVCGVEDFGSSCDETAGVAGTAGTAAGF